MRARDYSPATATFNTQDPDLAETQEDYSYASGDPVNRADPSGDWTLGICGGATFELGIWPIFHRGDTGSVCIYGVFYPNYPDNTFYAAVTVGGSGASGTFGLGLDTNEGFQVSTALNPMELAGPFSQVTITAAVLIGVRGATRSLATIQRAIWSLEQPFPRPKVLKLGYRPGLLQPKCTKATRSHTAAADPEVDLAVATAVRYPDSCY